MVYVPYLSRMVALIVYDTMTMNYCAPSFPNAAFLFPDDLTNQKLYRDCSVHHQEIGKEERHIIWQWITAGSQHFINHLPFVMHAALVTLEERLTSQKFDFCCFPDNKKNPKYQHGHSSKDHTRKSQKLTANLHSMFVTALYSSPTENEAKTSAHITNNDILCCSGLRVHICFKRTK